MHWATKLIWLWQEIKWEQNRSISFWSLLHSKTFNLSPSNMMSFYSFCEPLHTLWEPANTLLLKKCSTYKAMWQKVYCKFLPFECSWTCHSVWLWKFIPFSTPLDKNKLLTATERGVGCGRRNWGRRKERQSLSAKALIKKNIQAFWPSKLLENI